MAPRRFLNPAIAAAAVAAALMLLISIAAALGIYENAAEMMEQWHQFYSLTILGTIAGMLEAAAITFLAVAAFLWLNNKLGDKQ